MNVGRIAGIFHTLMTGTLGYDRYGVRGNDLGAGVLNHVATAHPNAIIGTHAGGTSPYVDLEHLPEDMTEREKEFIAHAKKWMNEEMAYALNDSPAGLAAWIIEKYRRWSDCDGDIEKRFSNDELLTTTTIYWAT